MTEKPALDPELHEDDTVMSVWKRRLVLILLIILVVAIAAPVFSGCGGALSAKKTVASFEVAGKTHEVSDEDLQSYIVRFNSMSRLLSQDPRRPSGLPEGEEGVKTALSIMMLDAAAKAEGVVVPDSSVRQILEVVPMFQGPGGKFDEARYRQVLSESGRGILTHESFTSMLKTQLRVQEYQNIYGAAFEVVPSDDAYEAWKKRNVKLTVDYVASSFDRDRAKWAEAHPSEEDLAAIKNLAPVQQILDKPPAKVIETAYVKAADMTAEQTAAAKAFLESAEVFTEDNPLADEAKKLFHFERDTVFTRDRWVKVFHPDYAAAKEAWQKEHDAWAALPKEEKEKKPEPKAPEDPAAKYPNEERAQFLEWRERTEKEVIVRELVRKLATDAERASKSLAEQSAEYGRFGVKVVKNDQALADKELVEKYPDPVARNSEWDQVALHEFKPQPEGQVFKPKYHVVPVPTTRLPDQMQDRGFMTMRLESCEPQRKWEIHERVNELLDFWRKYKTAESARKALEEIKKKAEAAGPDVEKVREALRKAAEEAGLSVETLRRFNKKTEAGKPPTAAPGQTLAPELAATAKSVAARNRVLQGYSFFVPLAPGKFADVIDDAKLESAFLVFMVEKQDPTPLEMQDAELRTERITLYQQSSRKMTELVGYDALAKRYSLQRFVDEKKKDKDKDAPSK